MVIKASLITLCAITCLVANAAIADDTLPKDSDWIEINTINYPTAATVYTTQDAPPAKIPPGYLAWFKVVFDKPQADKAGAFQTEIVQIKARCGETADGNSYAVIRDIKYSKDGKVVADVSTDEKKAKLKPARHYNPDDAHSTFTLYDGLGLDAFDGGCEP